MGLANLNKDSRRNCRPPRSLPASFRDAAFWNFRRPSDYVRRKFNRDLGLNGQRPGLWIAGLRNLIAESLLRPRSGETGGAEHRTRDTFTTATPSSSAGRKSFSTSFFFFPIIITGIRRKSSQIEWITTVRSLAFSNELWKCGSRFIGFFFSGISNKVTRMSSKIAITVEI